MENGCLPKKNNGRIKDFVPRRVYQPTLPTTWDTFIWEFIADHRTHPPITYLGIFMIKLGLFIFNSELILKPKT